MAHINHTGRKKIDRSEVAVELYKQDNPWRFNLSLDLKRFDFNGDEKVIVEATHSIVTERFTYGTVDTPYPQSDTVLELLTGRPNLYFRIKIVDPDGSGLILAEADGVPTTGASSSTGQKTTILKFEVAEHRPLPWWIDFNGFMPTVVIHKSITGGVDFAKSNHFTGLNYATIVEQVLTHICFITSVEEVSENTESDEELNWQALWIQFIKNFNPEDFDLQNTSDSDKREWILRCVDAFARSIRPLQKLKKDI